MVRVIPTKHHMVLNGVWPRATAVDSIVRSPRQERWSVDLTPGDCYEKPRTKPIGRALPERWRPPLSFGSEPYRDLTIPRYTMSRRDYVDLDIRANISDLFQTKFLEHGVRAYVREVEAFLDSMGIFEAGLSAIRRAGIVARGSTRCPLKVVCLDRPPFVVKTYDDYSPSMERRVLTKVSGVIAPRVLHFGERFYAEELVTGESLLDRTQGKPVGSEEVTQALLTCARVYARLCQLEVHYDHNHCMDEFFVTPSGGILVTDFGSSRFFHTPDFYSDQNLEDTRVRFEITHAQRERVFETQGPSELYSQLDAINRQCLLDVAVIRELKRYLRILQEKGGLRKHFCLTDGEVDSLLGDLDTNTVINLMRAVVDMERALTCFFDHQHNPPKSVAGCNVVSRYREQLRREFIFAYRGD